MRLNNEFLIQFLTHIKFLNLRKAENSPNFPFFPSGFRMTDYSARPQWYTVLGWLLSAIAFTGNIFIIILIASKTRLQCNTNWFLLSLSVADLGVSLSLYPGIYFCFPNIENGCQYILLAIFQWVFLYASVTNLCVLVLDRYIAIVKPFVYGRIMSKNCVLAFISMAWIVPSAAGFAPLTFTHLKHGIRYFTYVVAIVFELIPWVSLLLATSHLLFIARKHVRERVTVAEQLRYNESITTASENTPPSRQGNRVRNSIAFIIFVVTFYILCYSLTAVKSVCHFATFCPKPKPKVELAQQLLLIANSAFNPLVYGLLKNDIKREIRKTVGCCCFTRQLPSFQMEQRC